MIGALTRALVALLVAWFAEASSTAAAEASVPPTTDTYDGHARSAQGSQATPERGPPARHDRTITTFVSV